MPYFTYIEIDDKGEQHTLQRNITVIPTEILYEHGKATGVIHHSDKEQNKPLKFNLLFNEITGIYAQVQFWSSSCLFLLFTAHV